VIELTAVWPVLLNVQVCVAAVGAVVGDVLAQLENASTAGVLTFRSTLSDAAVPALGVAVSVPVYVAAVVPVVTVTVPHVAPAAQLPVGPLIVAPEMVE